MLKITQKQLGMSLIEAMIALVIISVGLLGIAALQIVALQQNASSQWHSKAVWYSNEMTDRILANNTQFDNYAGIDTSQSYSQDCVSLSCSPAQMLIHDAEDWATRVADLPSGKGIITANAGASLTVVVMWDDDGTGATGEGCSGNAATDLTCYSVTILN